MVKITAIDAAKWFIKNNLDVPRNTFDGNMKLQKLLYFSQLIHLAKYGEPLFDEPILAFQNGSVVEEVRHAYLYEHWALILQANSGNIPLSDKQLDTLQIAEKVFGELTARELSDLNHQHKTWIEAYENSKFGNYHEKALSVMTIKNLMENEVPIINEMLHGISDASPSKYEVINGRKFFYNPDEIQLTPEIMALLESFDGPDSAYSVYKDETAGIVIY